MQLRRAVSKTRSLLVIGLCLTGTVAGLGALTAAQADSIVALDTFNRTVSNGWGTADQGGSWSLLDSAADWSVTPTLGTMNTPAGGQDRGVLAAVSVQDVDVLAKIVLPDCPGSVNCDAYVIARYSGGPTPTYYRIGAVEGANRSTVFLRAQRSDGSNLASDLNTGVPAANGVVLWIRADFTGAGPTAIKARVWQDGSTEPSSWLLNTSDNTTAEQGAGAVGVRVRNEDWGSRHSFGYSSFTATGLSGSPPPSSTSSSSSSSSSSSTSSTSSTSTTTTTLAPPPSGSAASDTFQRSAPSGWGTTDSGHWWTVVGTPWNWSVSPGAGTVTVTPSSQELGYLSQFNIQNTDVAERVVLPKCTGGGTYCDAFVMGRYSPSYNPTYYRVGLVQGAGNADVRIRAQRNDGSNLTSDVDTHIVAADQLPVWLRVEFTGTNPTTIRARAWLDGTPEPSTWTLSITDGTAAEQKAGMVGVRFRNEDTASSHNFAVTNYLVSGTASPVTVAPNPTGPAHWLYVVNDGQVYAYDIDNNHALVKQFSIPEAGKRGVAASPGRGLLYISECGTSACGGGHGSLMAYDLVHNVVAWIANYSFGVDQFAITPDGSTIYMPHGADASDGTHSVIDASDGKPTASIQTGTNGHNTVVSLDGTQAYLAGYTGSNFTNLHVVNTATNQIALNAGPTIDGIRPFTINGKHTMAFTTSTSYCGFQALSLTTGQVLATVAFGGSCSWSASNAPSHGISLSPDETRVYVMDAALDSVQVYNVSGLPSTAPTFVATVPLTSISGSEVPCQTYCEREGWVLNDLSGRFLYVADTGNVISTSTLSVIATLPALQNTRLMIEVDWAIGTPSATSTRFGLGRVTG